MEEDTSYISNDSLRALFNTIGSDSEDERIDELEQAFNTLLDGL